MLLLGAATLLSCLGLAGCGGKQVAVDPYVYGSLRAVTRGVIQSPNYLFEIDAPKFEYVKGNVGIVRDGNLLEFLVAKDLEQNAASYQGTRLDVQRIFGATPHLKLRRVKRNGQVTAVDTAYAYVLPRVFKLTAAQTQTPGAPLPDLDWKNVDDAKHYLPKEPGGPQIQVQSLVARFVRAPLPTDPGKQAWFAVFPNASLELVDLNPGAEWMLELLAAKQLPLLGSFTLTEVYENYVDRQAEHGVLGHVVGKMRVNWLRYANTFVKGTGN
ncbi:MAG: hypothetical protein ACYDIE_13385 [Candidatus Krumholzibacteriia bacterium]